MSESINREKSDLAEKNPDFAEEWCRKANQYLYDIVFPILKEAQEELKDLQQAAKANLDSAQEITDEDKNTLKSISNKINLKIDNILSVRKGENDSLLGLMLLSRVHRIKNESLDRIYNALYDVIHGHTKKIDVIPFEFLPENIEFRPEEFRSGHIKLDETIDLVIFVEGKSADRRKIEINSNLSDFKTTHIFIDCHSSLTFDSFIELFKNAFDATPVGGKLNIKLEKKGENVIVTISDTGVGISEENLKKVFEKGFTTKPTGTGMGLPLVKTYFEDILHGKFELKSKEGKGTTVIVTLPLSKKQHD